MGFSIRTFENKVSGGKEGKEGEREKTN